MCIATILTKKIYILMQVRKAVNVQKGSIIKHIQEKSAEIIQGGFQIIFEVACTRYIKYLDATVEFRETVLSHQFWHLLLHLVTADS